jgi:hypothetical protein
LHLLLRLGLKALQRRARADELLVEQVISLTRADLQESEPDRATGGFGELRVSKAEKMRAKTRPKRASGVQVRFGCRGRHIRAGDWISAGATTGVHRADPGASVVVTYGNLGTIVLRLIRVEA